MQWNERFAGTCASQAPENTTPLFFYTPGTPGHGGCSPLEGMRPSGEGFGLKVEDVTLTTELKRYRIDASRDRYRKAVGGFGWVAVFSIEDIQ